MNVGSILNDDPPQSSNETNQSISPTTSNINVSPQVNPSPLPQQSNNNHSAPIVSSTRSSTQSVHQRHSITSMLNDAAQDQDTSRHSSTDKLPQVQQQQPQQQDDQFRKPSLSSNFNSPNISNRPVPTHFHSGHSSSMSSPVTSKRNSIANITNPEPEPIIKSESDHKSSNGHQEILNHQSQQESSKTEKKQTIPETEEDDLTRIQKIKKSNKPKRYDTPPIWAQRWIPPNQQNKYNNQHIQEGEPINNNGESSVRLSSKSILNRNSTRYVDLKCSITDVIPPNSITRTISEWIYANFSNIDDKNRKNVELELKFGKIIDKRTGNRININVITECIYTDQSNIKFDMEVEELAFKDIRKFFDELEKSYQEDIKRNGSSESHHHHQRRKFNILESDKTDSFYQIGSKGEHLRKVRISKDNLLDPPRFEAIQKERIGDLYIHNPQSMYDLRLSLSLEIPVPEGNIESIRTKNQPQLSREKKRISFTHPATITQFDLTKVLIPKEFKNKNGKKIINYDIKYEIEMEADTLELFQSIDKIVQGIDNFRLEELIEVFLNNARILNNRVTKLAL
ncbi:CET1 [Candida pseudojiufengensis]|uniref:CET1 n=1 Tax=Candida pseudojiufengensis TaxID=497109 RepID=UPI002223FDF4|nr:CET1 [Candida pseudojiufengensis]KAI5966727.1 CET1 [Candida pseudojiufengensis]